MPQGVDRGGVRGRRATAGRRAEARARGGRAQADREGQGAETPPDPRRPEEAPRAPDRTVLRPKSLRGAGADRPRTEKALGCGLRISFENKDP